MKTKAVLIRRTKKNRPHYRGDTEIVLYSMYLTKSSKRIVWRLTDRFGPFSPYTREAEIQKLAEQYNAYNLHNSQYCHDLSLWIEHNKEIKLEDPLKFFLLCMQLQKEQSDANESRY